MDKRQKEQAAAKEAEIEMKIRMDKYQPDKEDDFSYSGNSIKILDFKNYCRMNLPGRAYL